MKRHITRRRVTIIIGLLLLLLWWLWPNGQLAHVQALQKELVEAGDTLTPEQRREKGQQLRAEMDKLSPQERSQLRAGFQARMEDRMKKYFAMSLQEKQKYLDDLIHQQQQFAAQPPGNGGGFGGFGGPPNGKAMTPEDKERRRQQRLDNTTPEFRAQMDQFRKDMEQRRQQRGLPANPPGRGGR